MTEVGKVKRWLHEHHLCDYCREQDAFTLAGRWHCAECSKRVNAARRKAREEKPSEYSADEYQRRKQGGVCVQCGKRPAKSGKVRCKKCLEINRNAAKRAREKLSPEINLPRGDNGICYRCNKAPAIDGKRLCESCYQALAEQARNLPKPGKEYPWRAQGTQLFQSMRKSENTAKSSLLSGL